MVDSKEDEFARYLKSETGTAEKKQEKQKPAPPPIRSAAPRAPTARASPPPSRDLMKKALTLRKRRVLPSKRRIARAVVILLLVVVMSGFAVYYYLHVKIPVPLPHLAFDGSLISVDAKGRTGALEIAIHNTGQVSARISSILITDNANNPVLGINFPDEHCGGFNCVIFGAKSSTIITVGGNALIIPPGETVTVARPYQEDLPFSAGTSYVVTVSTLDTADVQFVIQAKANN